MGSTTPPETPHDQRRHSLSHYQQSRAVTCELNNQELRQLLEQRDLEIRHLKLTLERYKLALSALKLGNVESRVESDRLACATKHVLDNTMESLLSDEASYGIGVGDGSMLRSGIDSNQQNQTSLSKEISSHFGDPTSSSQSKVIFETGSNDDEGDNGLNRVKFVAASTIGSNSGSTIKRQDDENCEIDDDDDLTTEMQEIIQDVGEIDLDLEMKKENKKQRKASGQSDKLAGEIECDKDVGKKQHTDNGSLNSDNNNGLESDMLTDGLLTSLTDAALSNLNQLAALQERCESQQQHSQPKRRKSQQQQQQQQKQQQQPQPQPQPQPQQQQQKQQQQQPTPQKFHTSATPNVNQDLFCQTSTSILSAQPAPPPTAVVPTSESTPSSEHAGLLHQTQAFSSTGRRTNFDLSDPFSTSNLVNQAALALSASNSSSLLVAHRSSLSAVNTSNIRSPPDLGDSDQSLANVVVAAAAAAAEAAAVNEHQQRLQETSKQQASTSQHQQQRQAMLHPQQSRLISSAMASPDYYQSFQHPQQVNLAHQVSPISPLNYSPSPSSLIGLSTPHQARRSTSSSVLSPIPSPSYMRRQFLPERNLTLMSPSPTTSLGTAGSSGIGSGAGSAHILQLAQQQVHLHQQQQQRQNQPHAQQRSASALAGPITSPVPTSVSLAGASVSTAVSPLMSSKNSSQARLNNMQIRHKFGYLGSGRGQFNSPHGFCLGLNQEIVVADTNNHRVCIFDKDGTYITQFGSPGKEEGQLWNPRKVAILHRPLNGNPGANTSSIAHQHRGGAPPTSTGTTFSSNFTSGGGIQSTSGVTSGNHFASEPLYVVCDRGAERSRMQLFTKDGAFIKKIGIHYIDIVAGLAITQNGLIIVVDSVSPTVYIINAETGTLDGWFDCSGHMKEPSDIAVKSDIPGNEYFICDFKGHCVVVFSEQGDYLRKIGHDGLTSYPNGIDISDDGDILVGDSHGNRFHVVVFDRNGNFVSQFECPHVKVSRCCGLKITREGYIVTLAKNNHHVLVLDTIHI